MNLPGVGTPLTSFGLRPSMLRLNSSFYLEVPVLKGSTQRLDWNPGKVSPQDVLQMTQAFAGYMAWVYAHELKRAIQRQTYAWTWDPLSPRYAAHKRRQGLLEGMWSATGLLMDHIVAWRDPYHGSFIIGPDPKLHYQRGRSWVSIVQVAEWLEYGTRHMPARPLFRPLLRDLRRSLADYWGQFLLSKRAQARAASLQVYRYAQP